MNTPGIVIDRMPKSEISVKINVRFTKKFLLKYAIGTRLITWGCKILGLEYKEELIEEEHETIH